MEQRLTIVTVGVDYLAAMRDFYVDKFGWKPEAENKDIVFFKLGGVLLGWPWARRAAVLHKSPVLSWT